jgi:hypothetical protein
MNELTIRIYEASEEPGYFYDIYDTAENELSEENEVEGGHCTTTIENALEMAYWDAKKVMARD